MAGARQQFLESIPCTDDYGDGDKDVVNSRQQKEQFITKRYSSRLSKICTWKAAVVLLMFLVLLSTNIYLWNDRSKGDITSEALSDSSVGNSDSQTTLLKNPRSKRLWQSIFGGNDVRHINVGMRNDFRLQECQGPQFKQTFPDVDYALFGYNVLKGYPLAIGHDPGFSLPIFKADYTEGKQTADCRYSIPRGLVVVPDVSCVTSFTSETVQTKYEFAKSLSVAASVSGGGWGVSFSASAGYKESSSEISTGESVFILSTAKCVYYFSKLVTDDAPGFTGAFLQWVHRLNSSETKAVYLDFFDTYGTHFLSYVTFGARYTFEHKMSSKTFQSQRSKGVNVAVEASYSGLFSVGGGFSMDSSQKQSASDFSKSVTTKTITVGAPPPANGDAMTWASTVKDSPVPMEYKLLSIENLFSEKYMGNLRVDYRKIAQKIKDFQQDYCRFLKKDGQLDSCASLKPGIVLTKTRLHKHYKSKALSFTECINFCLQDIDCEAITYCKTCQHHWFKGVCYMYTEKYHKRVARLTGEGDVWQSIVFATKIKTHLSFADTNIIGSERGSKDTDSCLSMDSCESFCINDVHCAAFTFRSCSDRLKNCRLYSTNRIRNLKKESGITTYFIFNRETSENKS